MFTWKPLLCVMALTLLVGARPSTSQQKTKKRPPPPSREVFPTLLSFHDADVLRGVAGENVYLIPIDKGAVADGLTEDSVRTDAELKLRKAGVRLLTNTNGPFPGYPNLYIKITTQKQPDKTSYIYAVEVWEAENVHLERNPKVTVMEAPVWLTDVRVGTVNVENMPATIRHEVGESVTEFCEAYQSVNPKR